MNTIRTEFLWKMSVLNAAKFLNIYRPNRPRPGKSPITTFKKASKRL